ncbi:hypothetical protein AVEN_63187-1 [Araneus ventricosus]|uniref:Uncharacterized protein n=1 Tax=Araneus ventricosus TaxID=182803 RepID=A0A4Y2B1L2_ARAVE|nr:hypothetical protein AVEN_63187-1 [Araneus ventricosus]
MFPTCGTRTPGVRPVREGPIGVTRRSSWGYANDQLGYAKDKLGVREGPVGVREGPVGVREGQVGERWGHRGLVVNCLLWGRRFSGSKPDSVEDPPCMWVWYTLNQTSWVKRPPDGVVPVQVSSSSSGRGSKLRGPSQSSSGVASKRDVNIAKLNYFRQKRNSLLHECHWNEL